MHLASLVTQTVKSLPAMQETGFHPWVGKIPWRREWQPTPVLLTGKIPWMEEPGGLRSMRSESDTTKQLHFYLCMWRGQRATAVITFSCKHPQLNSLINLLFCSYQRIHLSTSSHSVQLTQWPRGNSMTHEHAPLKGTQQLMGIPLCVY